MIKKAFYTAIILSIVFLIIQYLIGVFYNHHDIKYEMIKNSEKIKINEIYEKTKEDDFYSINLEYRNKIFNYDISNFFNHQKKIVQDIEIKEKDNVTCIMLKFLKQVKYNYVRCYQNHEQIDQVLVNNIINIKSFNNYVDNELYNKSDVVDEKNNFYYKNIEDNEFVFIYKYHYIAELSTKGYKKNYFTTNNKDIYYNELSYMINNYLIFPQYTEDDLIDVFKIIDVRKNTHSYFNFDYPSSKTLYVQGIIDNKLYLVNRTDDTQYVIDPYRSVMEKMDSKYFDGKTWIDKNINDFITNKVLFPVRRYKALNKYDYIKVYQNARNYYFITKDWKFYQVSKKDINNKILLYSDQDIKDAVISNGSIYFIKNDIVYKKNRYGIKEVIKNNEFIYNFKNIVNAYYKEEM